MVIYITTDEVTVQVDDTVLVRGLASPVARSVLGPALGTTATLAPRPTAPARTTLVPEFLYALAGVSICSCRIAKSGNVAGTFQAI